MAEVTGSERVWNALNNVLLDMRQGDFEDADGNDFRADAEAFIKEIGSHSLAVAFASLSAPAIRMKPQESPMLTPVIESAARWSTVRAGVQDFDGPVLSIGSRVYARGNSGAVPLILTNRGWIEPPPDYSIPPGGSSSLVFHLLDRTLEIVSQDFTGVSEAEVEAALVAWVDVIVKRVYKAMCVEFGLPEDSCNG